jgi:hypothetical protein
MERAEAIATLLAPPLTLREPEATRARAECLIALGVTKEELIATRKQAARAEVRARRQQLQAEEEQIDAKPEEEWLPIEFHDNTSPLPAGPTIRPIPKPPAIQEK